MKCSKCGKEFEDTIVCPDCGITIEGMSKRRFIGLFVGIAFLAVLIPVILALIVIFIIPKLTSNKEALKEECCHKYNGIYENGECLIDNEENLDYWDTKTNMCMYQNEE